MCARDTSIARKVSQAFALFSPPINESYLTRFLPTNAKKWTSKAALLIYNLSRGKSTHNFYTDSQARGKQHEDEIFPEHRCAYSGVYSLHRLRVRAKRGNIETEVGAEIGAENTVETYK